MSDLSQPVPPPPGSPQPPVKKGLGPLGWVLIGCGGLVLIAALVAGGIGWFATQKVKEFGENPAFNAAKLAVQMNPEVELLSADEDANTLTIRNKKSGKTMTINAGEVKEGRWSVETEEGKTVFDASGRNGTFTIKTDKGETATIGGGSPKSFPSWLPTYPGGTVEGTFDTTNAQGRSAAFTVKTSDSVSEVLDYYEERLKDSGLKVDKSTYSADDRVAGGSVSGTSEDRKRTASVMVATSGDGTAAVVSFQDKN